MNRIRRFAFAFALLAPGTSQAVTEIQLWHSMAGAPGERLQELVGRFNASQRDYRVSAVFKGGYEEITADALGGRAKLAPHIIQAPDAATGTLLAAKSAFRPVHQVMADAGEKLDPKSFYAPLAAYFMDAKGKLVALPFSVATPVFFYNKDAFRKVGLDPNQPPKTWRDLQVMALKLRDADFPCSYSTSWQAWIYLENLAAWHNEPIATRSNGFDGLDSALTFNSIMMVRHISLLSSWVKSFIFTYAGRNNEADEKFYRGECMMLTTSSSAYAGIVERARFEIGISAMPYYDEFPQAPYNSILGGAGLWVTSGKSHAEYRGVAKFLAYLTRPQIEAEWHQMTGYLPVGPAAFALSLGQGFYRKQPGYEVFVRQLVNHAPTASSRGLRVGNLQQVRAVVDEELEAVWNQLKTPKEALDDAVTRGNVLLRSFERAYKH